jgi:preprotein translocase subunit SecA
MVKIEETRKNFENEEDFFELERRVVLQTIDEIWMFHIDSMSKLREAVAFE